MAPTNTCLSRGDVFTDPATDLESPCSAVCSPTFLTVPARSRDCRTFCPVVFLCLTGSHIGSSVTPTAHVTMACPATHDAISLATLVILSVIIIALLPANVICLWRMDKSDCCRRSYRSQGVDDGTQEVETALMTAPSSGYVTDYVTENVTPSNGMAPSNQTPGSSLPINTHQTLPSDPGLPGTHVPGPRLPNGHAGSPGPGGLLGGGVAMEMQPLQTLPRTHSVNLPDDTDEEEPLNGEPLSGVSEGGNPVRAESGSSPPGSMDGPCTGVSYKPAAPPSAAPPDTTQRPLREDDRTSLKVA